MKPFLGWWAGAFVLWVFLVVAAGRRDAKGGEIIRAAALFSFFTATFIWGVFY